MAEGGEGPPRTNPAETVAKSGAFMRRIGEEIAALPANEHYSKETHTMMAIGRASVLMLHKQNRAIKERLNPNDPAAKQTPARAPIDHSTAQIMARETISFFLNDLTPETKAELVRQLQK